MLGRKVGESVKVVVSDDYNYTCEIRKIEKGRDDGSARCCSIKDKRTPIFWRPFFVVTFWAFIHLKYDGGKEGGDGNAGMVLRKIEENKYGMYRAALSPSCAPRRTPRMPSPRQSTPPGKSWTPCGTEINSNRG